MQLTQLTPRASLIWPISSSWGIWIINRPSTFRISNVQRRVERTRPGAREFNFPDDHFEATVGRDQSDQRSRKPASKFETRLRALSQKRSGESPRGIAAVGIKRGKTSCLTWLGYANNWGPTRSATKKTDNRAPLAQNEAAESVSLFSLLAVGALAISAGGAWLKLDFLCCPGGAWPLHPADPLNSSLNTANSASDVICGNGGWIGTQWVVVPRANFCVCPQLIF